MFNREAAMPHTDPAPTDAAAEVLGKVAVKMPTDDLVSPAFVDEYSGG